ncbi:MAG: alpha/beta hydrolase [Hyphomicrobiales bacterium]|nr:MAG: alpha/beta hydrolase [Hyphomicrobiales bacterium]
MSSITRSVQVVEHKPGTALYYTVSGPPRGEAVVFIHGWTCLRSDFDQLISHLPADWRTVAIDLAEHGDSRSTRTTWTMADFADDVAAVLDAESLNEVTVVGHSMGGAVALELARQRPSTVTHIIGLDTFHYLSLYPRVDEDGISTFMAAFNADIAGTVRGFVEMGSVPSTDPDFKEKIFQKMSSARQPAGLHVIEEILRWDMDGVLQQVHQPIDVLAVGELLDPEAISRYGGRVNFVPVELGSHHFLLEQPEATATLLIELINNTANSTSGANL